MNSGSSGTLLVVVGIVFEAMAGAAVWSSARVCCAELLGRRECHETEGRSAFDTDECMDGCCVFVCVCVGAETKRRVGCLSVPIALLPMLLPMLLLLLLVAGVGCWQTSKMCLPETVAT